MPEFLEKAIRHKYKNSGLSKEEVDRRVYGHMNDIGAMSGNKETPKGEAMEAKHEGGSAYREMLKETES